MPQTGQRTGRRRRANGRFGKKYSKGSKGKRS